MDLLTKLLTVDAPENTTLSSAELSFRGLFSWWIAGLLFAALVVVTVVLYRSERGTLGWPRRILLILLRCASMGLLLLLLFRPVLLAEFTGERPRGVVLLLDDSKSMKLQDRRLTDKDKWRVAIAHGFAPLQTPLEEKMSDLPAQTPQNPPRTEMVKQMLRLSELHLLDRLQKFGPLRTFLFAGPHDEKKFALQGTQGERTEGDVTDRLLNSFRAQKDHTALADAIFEVLQSKDADPPSAIVVITDGQDNASKFTLAEAAAACKDAGIPIHIYGVGSSEGGTLQLKELGVPDTLFVDDTIVVPLRWRAQGLMKTGNVEITLTLGGKEIARKKLAAQSGEDLREFFSFIIPKGRESEESQNLVASIRYDGAENLKDSLTRTVRVIDRKIRVLYIENSPRWEFKFLQPAMLRDRRIEPHYLLVNADPKVSTGGLPFLSEFPKTREKFFEAQYNLIILGDVPSTYLGKEHMEWIREFVQNRGGLILLSGRQNMPNTYEHTPLTEVFPVEFAQHKFGLDVDIRTQEYPPTLTEAGLRSDMLALADTPEENLDVWQKKLPGFHWQFPITKLRPAAQALIVNPRARLGEQPMPLLATQYYGKGQVIFLGSDESWRWRWNYQEKYFVRFWGQLIYQTGLPSLLGTTANRSQMALEKAHATIGRQNVYVRLLDKDFNPRKDPQVESTLVHIDAQPGQERSSKVILQAIAGRPGEYRALLDLDRPGRFELKVNNPETATFPFRVELPPRHELEESGLAEKALREMAQISGGQLYREEDLYRLADNLELRKAPFMRRQEVLLWSPLVLFLFLGLITFEWIVRKFANLS